MMGLATASNGSRAPTKLFMLAKSVCEDVVKESLMDEVNSDEMS